MSSRPSWVRSARASLGSGLAAGALSSAALAARGRLETGSPYAPVNATSRALWGDEATRQDRPSVRHTIVGAVIHHAAALFWGTLYERIASDRAGRRGPGRAVAAGVAVAGIAALVDYTVTPRRLRPGYETRLSTGSLVAAYAAFAVGLALQDVLTRRTPELRTADPRARPGPAARGGGVRRD